MPDLSRMEEHKIQACLQRLNNNEDFKVLREYMKEIHRFKGEGRGRELETDAIRFAFKQEGIDEVFSIVENSEEMLQYE